MSEESALPMNLNELVEAFKHAHIAVAAKRPLTDAQRKAIYLLGYQEIQQGHFRKALDFFVILTLRCPTERSHWMGLGLALQKLDKFQEALLVFSLLGVLFDDAPEALLAAGECQLHLGQLDGARDAFEVVMRYHAREGGSELIDRRARSLLNLLGAHGVKAA